MYDRVAAPASISIPLNQGHGTSQYGSSMTANITLLPITYAYNIHICKKNFKKKQTTSLILSPLYFTLICSIDAT